MQAGAGAGARAGAGAGAGPEAIRNETGDGLANPPTNTTGSMEQQYDYAVQ